jgi:hypothetical protein
MTIDLPVGTTDYEIVKDRGYDRILCNGAITLMFEGVPTYPDAGRFWDICDKYKVDIFYTAPTAIRALAVSLRQTDVKPALTDGQEKEMELELMESLVVAPVAYPYTP